MGTSLKHIHVPYVKSFGERVPLDFLGSRKMCLTLVRYILKSSEVFCGAVYTPCWRHLARTPFVCPTGSPMMWLLSCWAAQDMSRALATSETGMSEALVEHT